MTSNNKKIIVADIRPGDIFSESSHYIYKHASKEGHVLTHLQSKTDVVLGTEYVEDLLKTADQYQKVEKVGKEDKLWTQKQIDDYNKSNPSAPTEAKVGDVRVPGIRSVWDSIHSSQVFTVCFNKADKPLSAKKLTELREAQIATQIEAIEKAQRAKKGVANAAKAAMDFIQKNPIVGFEPGEERVLRGYKVQFTSRDGRYDCVDMDFPDGFGAPNVRPVNINTLQWIVFDGVKYEME